MPITSDRVRGVQLRVLNLRALAGVVQQSANCVPLKPVFEPYALGTAPDGRSYVVCGEGVGWEVTQKPFSLDLYSDSDGRVSLMPLYTVELSLAELQPYITEEVIDLADLVRAFGGRLEDNFWILHRALSRQAMN